MRNESKKAKAPSTKPKRFYEIMDSNNKILCRGRILMGFFFVLAHLIWLFPRSDNKFLLLTSCLINLPGLLFHSLVATVPINPLFSEFI